MAGLPPAPRPLMERTLLWTPGPSHSKLINQPSSFLLKQPVRYESAFLLKVPAGLEVGVQRRGGLRPLIMWSKEPQNRRRPSRQIFLTSWSNDETQKDIFTHVLHVFKNKQPDLIGPPIEI